MFYLRPYNPFCAPIEFIAYINKDGVIKKIENSKLDYVLRIKQNGYLPKTGILLCYYLNSISVKDLNVLDIGTGETAIFAIHLAKMGAKMVAAIDLDYSAVRWARKNIKMNNLSKKVIIKKIALQKYKPDFKFDLIISNPPQMPVKKFHSLHDDGGYDGKFYIRQIIKFAAVYLNNDGVLIFTTFDFLGVDRSYNNQPSLYDLFRKYSFVPKIVEQYERTIKSLSYTAKNIQWIKTQFPQYRFSKNDKGLPTHKIFVISAKKR